MVKDQGLFQIEAFLLLSLSVKLCVARVIFIFIAFELLSLKCRSHKSPAIVLHTRCIVSVSLCGVRKLTRLCAFCLTGISFAAALFELTLP